MPLHKRLRRIRFAVFVLPGGIVTALLALYWLVYVPAQKRDLASFYFRSLADAGDHIQSELQALSGPLTNSLAKAIQTESEQPVSTERLRESVRNLEITIDRNRTNGTGHIIGHVRGRDVTLKYNAAEGRCLFQDLVDPIARRLDFSDVLVLDGTRKVLYQQGGSDVRFLHLELGPEADSQTFQTNWVSKGEPKRQYLFFSQPFQFPYPVEGDSRTNSAPENWIICGIVQPRAFLQQAMALPTLAILLVLGGAVFLLLAWPILNARCSTYGRMTRWRNVLGLHLSATAACALLCLLLLAYGASKGIQSSLNNQMGGLATNILESFRAEAGAVHEQLMRFDKLRFEEGQPLTNTNRIRIFAHEPVIPAEFYPFFTMVFWTDTNGQQIVKWTPEDENTAFINVGERVYHSSVATGRHWIWEETTRQPFFLEPIYSWNSAENLAVWTMEPTNKINGIAAMVVKFRSILSPILPVDFGFCVVDESGRALFHSDEHRNLRENFFTESSAGTALRAAVRSGQTASFGGRYLGQRHSMFVTPMPSLPWSLITFRDESQIESMTFQALWLGVCVYVAGLLLWVLGLLLVVTLAGRAWLYPDPRRARGYLWVAFTNAAAGMVLLVWAALGGPADLWLLVAVLLPLGSICVAACVLSREGSSNNCGINTASCYTFALASLFFITAVVPAFLLSRVFFQSELELIVKRTQFILAEQMVERELRAREETLRLEPSDGIEPRRLSNEWDLHFTNVFATRITDAQTNSQPSVDGDPWLRWVTKTIGLQSAKRQDTLGYARGGSLNRTNQQLTLTRSAVERNLPGGGRSVPMNIESNLPPVWPGGTVRLMLAAALSFGIAWLLALLVSRTTFVFKMPRVAGQSHPLKVVFDRCWADGEPWARWPRRSWQSNLDSGSGISTPPEVIVEGFGENAEDAEATEQKMDYVFGLLADPEREVILLTNAHPLSFALNIDDNPGEALEAKRRRWVQLFRTCEYVYPEEQLLPGSASKAFSRVWAACSPTERDVLYHISTSNLADPKSPDLGKLQKRKLIEIDPIPRIVDPGFREWVARNYCEQTALKHLRRAEGGWWTKNSRTVFWFLVVSGLLFFLTQQMALDSMVAMIGGLATALVALVNVTRIMFETRQSAKV